MKETNEELIEFPCHFPLKAIGKNEVGFKEFVVEVVVKHVPELTEEAVSSRMSANGTYQSVTATFTAQSRAQVDALYEELSADKRVVMLL